MEFKDVEKCPVCTKPGTEGTWSNLPAIWHDGVQDPCVDERTLSAPEQPEAVAE